MHEASKSRDILLSKYPDIFTGSGIDIGCGNDPVTGSCDRYDIEQGDANLVSYDVLHKKYDWVFSSHCLEHMIDPGITICNWWSLVKHNGKLIILVPDEDLYEQGVWPSTYNQGHLHTFTINKLESWSPVSVNLLSLYRLLPGDKELLDIQVQNKGYRYNIGRVDQTMKDATAQICMIVQKK